VHALTTDDVLLGIGLVTVLGIGAQLLARPLRLPAIVVLLPVGFVAGILTGDVQPAKLLGPLYQPFVSVAVGVILFEAGLRLSFAEMEPGLRKTVGRLVLVGGTVTWACVAAATGLLYPHMNAGVAVVIGAVLVVSGPTVVLPLLAFVRPAGRIRTVLTWEGILIDPIGALLGATVFAVVLAGRGSWHPGTMLAGLAIGAAVGMAAAALLVWLVPWIQRNAPRQVVPAVLMVVVAALVGGDLLRNDAGFVATALAGVLLANQRRADLSATAEFQSSLVQVLIGVLFILISASVSPSAIKRVLPEALVLVAVMVLVVRPLAVAAATWRSPLPLRERAFAAGLAPRGIVAGATASAFGLQLADAGLAGANDILPIAFVAILGTVVVYGLGAAPLARVLDVAGRGGTIVLVVGGNAHARTIATALAHAGVRVRLWSGMPEEQHAARDAGLPADKGRMMLGALAREVELEDVTDALVLTANDDLNLLATAELREQLGHGHVFRLAPDARAGDLVPPEDERDVLADRALTPSELGRRLRQGGRLITGPAEPDGGAPTRLPLFAIGPSGTVAVATPGHPPPSGAQDRVIALVADGRAEDDLTETFAWPSRR
jgi:NhaP-type Na+/H+ or K+/H+ antiporter